MRSITARAIPTSSLWVTTLLLLAPSSGWGQEHEHDHGVADVPAHRHLAHSDAHGGFPAYVDIFFTHHAYLERKIHPRIGSTFADELREHEASGELVWQFGPRWGAELSAAFLATDPETGEGSSGLSDVEVAPMLALLQDAERLLIVSVRSGFVLPTGNEEEGLGADGWGWEPGLLIWKGFGGEKRGAIQLELGYERVFTEEGEDEQEIVTNLGLSYWLPSNWIPIVEINGVSPIGDEVHGEDHGEEHEASGGLVPAHGEVVDSEETLVSGTFGFRYAFANGQQWGAGVQLPLNDRDLYDARLVFGGIIHVD